MSARYDGKTENQDRARQAQYEVKLYCHTCHQTLYEQSGYGDAGYDQGVHEAREIMLRNRQPSAHQGHLVELMEHSSALRARGGD